jgi:folate-binding Fe-S cluster repair protein YgfZ
MKTLAANSWMRAAFPNVQGRLLAVVRILNRADGFLIDTEAATHDKVVQLLGRFTLAGDFRVTDLTDQTACYSVQGSRLRQSCVRCLATRVRPDPGQVATAKIDQVTSRLSAILTRLKTDSICSLNETMQTPAKHFSERRG